MQLDLFIFTKNMFLDRHYYFHIHEFSLRFSFVLEVIKALKLDQLRPFHTAKR